MGETQRGLAGREVAHHRANGGPRGRALEMLTMGDNAEKRSKALSQLIGREIRAKKGECRERQSTGENLLGTISFLKGTSLLNHLRSRGEGKGQTAGT